MLVGAGLLIGVAYLVGSVPSAYIVGRLLRGLDIRRYGSGSVSGSNVWQTVSRRATIPVYLIDVGKGIIPVLLAKLLGLDLPWQVAVGLASIIGHNWSLFLHFQGGRGLVTAGAFVLVIAPRELVIAGTVVVVGLLLLRNLPLASGLAVLSLPLASLGLEEPPPLTWGLLGILTLVMLKRLLGNRLPSISSHGKRVIIYRLVFDRDIRDRRAWIRRQPPEPVVRDEEAGR
ncbi:MAG: glycerol-3-phosphate acyltransferase [Dehalococcoidia bacterium]